jgi:Terminase large subunit, T4likevirus-type, N-terminal
LGWRAFLATLFGLPLGNEEQLKFRQCTGRDEPPQSGSNEAWLVCGRRAGKSFTLALIAVFLAAFRDWRPHLGPGEVATVVVIAADRKQARVIMRYCQGLLRSSPMLARIIEGERVETINLANRVALEIHTASFKTVRGYSIVAALCDEIAFWPSEDSASPDTEILDALRPAMATIPGAMLLCASSPYAQRGALWDAWKRHYGKESPILVWQAPTRTMNPTVPQSIVDAAFERDPAIASAEWMGHFRSDVEAFIAREAVEAVIIPDRLELAPIRGLGYVAFCDPSGGSGSDSFALAIAHRDGEGHGILDCVREVRPPFSPDAVVAEFAALLKSYGIHKVHGDRYGGDWPAERFRVHATTYEASEKAKSTIYQEFLPLLNSRRVELLDHSRAIAQLCGLERRTARSGKDSIDHGPGGHDDLANVIAGALVLAAGKLSPGQQLVEFGRSEKVRAFLANGSPNELPRSAIIHQMNRWGMR